MAQLLPHLSVTKKPSFFNRKMDAYRSFGKAVTRPQANFREYLLEKRKLNLGYTQRENSNLEKIRRFTLRPDDLLETPEEFAQHPRPINKEMFTVVASDEEFDTMFQHLKTVKEITLDMEGNDDHSYYGMTCLIQIGTYEKNYLIDPFPQYENVKTRLKKILESTRVLKIVHGGDNDFLSMNRDFGICMAGVLDLQFVQQQVFSTCLQVIKDGGEDYLRQNDVLWRSATDERGNLMSTEILSKLSKERIGLKPLAKMIFPKFPEPTDATLADWRIRPLESNREMVRYAVYDVYILLHIWNKMKAAIRLLELPEIMLATAVKETTKLLEKHFSPKPADSLDKKLGKAGIIPINRRLFEILYEFRTTRAQIVDESEEEILKFTEINKIISLAPTTEDQLQAFFKRERSIPSESIKESCKPLLKLLTEGEEFHQKMRTVKCHVCNGRFEYPHLAWGCIEKYSQLAVNNYMFRPENAAFRQKEHERRVKKWHAKRGPDVQYPYTP